MTQNELRSERSHGLELDRPQSLESDPAKPSALKSFLSGKTFLVMYAVVPVMLFGIFMWLYPTAYGIYAGNTRWNPIAVDNTPEYIGLDNYRRIFEPGSIRNQDLMTALSNSVKFGVFTVGIGIPLALVLATMINSLGRAGSFFRFIYFLPVVTSTIAVGIIWGFLYQPQFGLFNAILRVFRDGLGLNFALPTYLLDPRIALYCIGVMVIWQTLGFNIVIYMAGLSGVPREYYEAASIDGAGTWTRFRHITIPLLQPAILFTTITGVAAALQAFDAMYILSPNRLNLGGPARSTLTLVMLLFNRAFPTSGRYEFGYASALGVIIFALVLVVSLIQLRLNRNNWEY